MSTKNKKPLPMVKSKASYLLAAMLVGSGYALTLPFSSNAFAQFSPVLTDAEDVTGVPGVQANTSTGALSSVSLSSGNATTATLSAGATTTGTLSAGNATTATLSAGATTTGTLSAGNTTVNGTLTSSGNTTLGTSAGTVNTFGSGSASTNTFGNAGTSTNLIQGATNTIIGTTNINTSGGANTNIGSLGSVNNITGTTNTIQGNTNNIGTLNAAGATAATTNNIGNALSTNNIQGTTTNIGTTGTGVAGQANTINIGQAASAGGSTVNFNGNRLQGVAAGINGTDAVNMNQYNSLQNRVNANNQSMNNNVNALKYGVAGVTAAANIPGLNKDQDFNIGMGVGGYQGFGAMAVGANMRVYDNITAKVTGSTGGGQTSGGVGLSIGW